MNLDTLKFEYFKPNSQVILFDENGMVTTSCDTMVRVAPGLNVFEEVPFLQGLQELVQSLRPGADLTYRCVHTSLFGLTTFFDFCIREHSSSPDKTYMFAFYDFKDQYLNILELQQERNVGHIQNQSLQRLNNELINEVETLEKLNESLRVHSNDRFVMIKSNNLLINVDLKNILYFEAYGDYVKVYTTHNTYINYNTMKNVMDKLPEQEFVRVHRSYIIRLDQITNIEQDSLLVHEKVIPVGKSYKTALLERVDQL